MERVVVDASVIVKWFVSEEYTGEALLLRDDHALGCVDIVVPDYALLEVASALRKYVLRGLLSADDAVKAVELLAAFELGVERVTGALAAKALSYSLRTGVTVYDAYYIVLAREQGTAFYTADEKLLESLKGREPVARHVKDYKPRCVPRQQAPS